MLKIKNSYRPSEMAISLFVEAANQVEMNVIFISRISDTNENKFMGILEKVIDGKAIYHISNMSLMSDELATRLQGNIDTTPYTFPEAMARFTNVLKDAAKTNEYAANTPIENKAKTDTQQKNNKTHLWVPMDKQMQFKDMVEPKGYMPAILSKTFKDGKELDSYVGLVSNAKDNLIHVAKFTKNGELEIESEGSELPKALMKMAIQLEV